MANLKANSREKVAYSLVENAAPALGARHFQIFLYFLIVFIAYGLRVNLSVAIVAMTDPSASNNPEIPTYPHWTQKGAILSAFFWGYVWPQILAGYVANRFGAKWFLVSTMGAQSMVGFCTPTIAAHFGEVGVMVGRAAQGFCQGFLLPSVTHLLAQWTPHEERARMNSFCYGSVPFGTVIAMLVTGTISSTAYGWPMVFHLYGALGILVCILLAFFGYNSPADHPSISQSEKYYIESSLGHTEAKPSHKVPWKALVTSRPLWALLFTQCGFAFGFWFLLTQIPSYMKYILGMDIKKNSLVTSLPYFILFVLSIFVSFLSDFIINKNYLKRSTARKVFNFLGTLVPSTGLIMMGYVKPDEQSKAIWLLIVAIGLSAMSNCGWGLNHMDLSPNYAGTLMGICNGISNIFAAIAPLAVQLIIKDQSDPAQWRKAFFMAGGVQIVGGLIFNLFGSAEVQPWNDSKSESVNDKKETEKIVA